MLKSKVAILHFFAITPAIIWTIAGRLAQVLNWLVATPLIAKFLSLEEQGYYYTFASLIALQVVLEAGMSAVVIQMISHEAAVALPGTNGVSSAGILKSRQRLAAILVFSLRWFAIIALIAAIALLVVGIIFFQRNSTHTPTVDWLVPWIVASFAIGTSIVNIALLAILEGLGRVAEAAAYRCAASLIAALALCLSLAYHLHLYAIGLSLILSTVGSAVMVGLAIKSQVKLILEVPPAPGFSWMQEVGMYQLKIATSWISGWVIFQIIPPFVFSTFGAKDAGRFGLAMQIVNGIQSVAAAWCSTKQAPWGALIAQGKVAQVNREYKTMAWVGSGVALGACVIVVCALELSPLFRGFQDRLPSLRILLILLFSAVANQLVFAQAFFLRAFKTDPFMYLSLAFAAAMLLPILTGMIHEISQIAYLYTGLTLIIGVGGGSAIFRQFIRNIRVGQVQ